MNIDRDIAGVRLRAQCAQALAPQAESVLDTFAQLAERGTALHEGMQIRFGWSLLHLIADGGGLTIAEPDFVEWPSDVWNSSIDITLEVLSDQVRVLKMLDVSGSDAMMDQILFAAEGALDSDELFLRRSDVRTDEDSGWLLGTVAAPEALAQENGLQAISIAHLVAAHRSLLQVLALPTDFIAIFRQGVLREIFDNKGQHYPIA